MAADSPEGLLLSGPEAVAEAARPMMSSRELQGGATSSSWSEASPRPWPQPTAEATAVAGRRRRFVRIAAVTALLGVAAAAAVVGLAPPRVPPPAASRAPVPAAGQQAIVQEQEVTLAPRSEDRGRGGAISESSATTAPAEPTTLPAATTTKAAAKSTTVKEGTISKTFVIGQDVEGKLSSGEWVKGRIFTDYMNGTYEVVWRSGSKKEVQKSLQDLRKTFNSGQTFYGPRAGVPWVKGTIAHETGDGTYTVDWMDGDNVDTIRDGADLIQAFDVGQAVEGTRGGITGNRGEVVEDFQDGTFRIQWADKATHETTKSGDYLRRAVHVGQEVECTRAGIPVTRGSIIIYSGFGNYTVEWSDGQKIETSKNGSRLVPFLSAGMAVEAKSNSTGEWKNGVIAMDHGGDTFTVLWDDGSTTDRVKKGTDIRKAFYVGEEVSAVFRGTPNKRATITSANGKGSYDLRWKEGSQDVKERTKFADEMYSAHNVGDKVKAPRGGLFYFDATIRADRQDGTYIVSWSDGGRDDTIKKGGELRRNDEAVQTTAAPLSTVPTQVFVVGMEVFAHYWGPKGDVNGNSGEWVRATIIRKNPDGTFLIAYQDGRQSELTKFDYELRKAFLPGVLVYGLRSGVWKKGTIVADNGDGSYTVQWADGVSTESIKSSTELVGAFEVGEAVLGMRGGLPNNIGTVTKDNGDSTFEVTWKDGTLLEKVKKGDELRPIVLIGQQIEGTRGGAPATRGKVVGKTAGGFYTIEWKDGKKIETSKHGVDLRPAFTVGMYVKVWRSAGKGNGAGEWVVATIIRTYSTKVIVMYEDGAELETTKPDDQVERVFFAKQLVAGPRGSSPEVKGTILVDHKDGTYELRWLDGSQTETVKYGWELHRVFKIGDDVKGARGGDMPFYGVVSKDYKDGTYLLDWTDSSPNDRVKKGGELREAGVDKRIPLRVFVVGQPVEGRFWGPAGAVETNPGKWKKAKVESDNGDGTYTIAWDDKGANETTKYGYELRPLFLVKQQVVDGRGGRWTVAKYYNNGTYQVAAEGKAKTTAMKNYGQIALIWTVGQHVRGIRVDVVKTGKIKKDNGNGTYEVAWDDGNLVDMTQQGFDLWRADGVMNPLRVFWVGEDVEGLRGGTKLLRGKVAQKFDNGSYAIEWADGDSSRRVQSAGFLFRVFHVGEAVEAQKPRRSGPYERGTISAGYKNSTYLIAWKGGSSAGGVRPSDEIRRAFDAGDAVHMGMPEGATLGKVAVDNKNGTYAVDWEGGKQGDLRVANSIRKLPGTVPPPPAASSEAPVAAKVAATAAPTTAATTAAPTTTTAAGPTTAALRFLEGDHQIVAEFDMILVKWFVSAGDTVNTSSKLCTVRRATKGRGRALASSTQDLKCPFNGTVAATLDVRPGEPIYKGEHVVAVNDFKAGFPWWVLLLLLLCCAMCVFIYLITLCREEDEYRPVPPAPPKEESQPARQPAQQPKPVAAAPTPAAPAPTPAAPPPQVQEEPENPNVTVIPAPQGTPFDFLLPNGQKVTKHLSFHPLGAMLGRTHGKTDIEKLHFASYAEAEQIPIKSKIVKIGNENIPENMEQHVLAKKILDELRQYPVWPLKVTFDTGSGGRKTFNFTKSHIGIKFTKHMPITIEQVTSGEEADRLGVQKGWKIVQIHNVDCSGHKFDEINSKLHDGLHHLDPEHHKKSANKHHC